MDRLNKLTPALAILTSGGDSQGMNAALRAVVRATLSRGVPIYAIYEGYEGMVEGGARIRQFSWNSVGGIMQRGGTVIGTARSASFRSREGRLRAARNLIERGISFLVVIGGDGSLTGANLFRQEWPGLVAELAEQGLLKRPATEIAPLRIVGVVGSIDNDMAGTDMTIGADSALHRIIEAIDAIRSTAASHQRAFVVEVMGRNCGYLALISAIAGGADYVFIPENPPEPEAWKQAMCDILRGGRAAGRRESLVVVSEGARDSSGNPISAEEVRRVLAEQLGEDARVTILGHVQRGGSPSAFDRWMSTLVGYTAAEHVLDAAADAEPQMIGMRYNRITRQPLMECVRRTHQIAEMINAHEYASAMRERGGSFTEMYNTFTTLAQAQPHAPAPGSKRIAVLNAGDPAPGMNTAVYAAMRLGVSAGHQMLAVRDGFEGLAAGQVEEFGWGSVEGWEILGGSELGTSNFVPRAEMVAQVAYSVVANQIDALLVVGGWEGFEATHILAHARGRYPALNIPIICLPATIDNNIPGSELAIGADSALNTIVQSIDSIKQSAVATRRCFIVEVMGGECGYLALMSGLATGAERVYLPEEGISMAALLEDVRRLSQGFRGGKRLGLLIRSELANHTYSTGFICALLEEEGQHLFEARQAILGHAQEGGVPSPFDRVQATRLAAHCIEYLGAELQRGGDGASYIGIRSGRIEIMPVDTLRELADANHQRPQEQWWLALREVARVLAQEDSNQ